MGTKHSTEFRQEAVRVALTSGLTRKQVAADFGIGFSTLSRWIQQGRQPIEELSVQSDLDAGGLALSGRSSGPAFPACHRLGCQQSDET